MASGFVQRWKGKVTAAELWIAGTKVAASAADLTASYGLGSLDTVTNSAQTGSSLNTPLTAAQSAGAAVVLDASTVQANFTVGAPFVGANLCLWLSTVGSSGAFIKASTTPAAFGNTFQGTQASGDGGGSTKTSVIKSTAACVISMRGISTSQWLLTSIVPTTLVLVFSTST